ncbi:MAG: helix-turn-helix transcriptional regulator [Solirubrobacteraceae bacterium]
MSNDDRDFLDEVIEESTSLNPDFPQLVAQARRKRELLAALRRERRRSKVSQKVVAAAMGTSQSAVSELEKTASDAKVSTVEKYAGALGFAVQYHLVPLGQVTEPTVVIHDQHSI